MLPRNSLRRRARIRLFGAALMAGSTLAVPVVARAAEVRPDDGALSPRLAELARPSIRSAPPERQAKALSLAAEGPGSLLRDGNRVLVEVRFDHGAAASTDELRAAGAEVVNVSPPYQTVTVAAKPGQLRALSNVRAVAGVTEVIAPIVAGASAGSTAASAAPCFGAATSEGDEQLSAARARAEFEVDGSGVKVGILSDSFNRDGFAATREEDDVATGDLPGIGNPCSRETPVEIIDDSESNGEDEGRAMAQIVHDLAPGSPLSFATAFTGIPAFQSNIRALATAGAKVIADDVSYFEEPFFQEGPVGVAIKEVTEADEVSYFSSAGNNNLIDSGRDISSWEAPQFREAVSCPAGLSLALRYVSDCMDFDPGAASDPTFGLEVASGATLTLDLQWNEPWYGVQTDLDAYLLDENGVPILDEGGEPVRSEFANVTTTQKPFEFLSWENDTGSAQKVQIAINRYTGPGGGGSASPRLKLALLENGGGVTSTEYPESSEGDVVGPTIFGHNGAKDATSVGAIRYTTNEAPEPFSSRGPVTYYFGPVEGITQAAPLGSPEVLPKPDIVATDGGANTFFGSCRSDVWRFFGTSAAAPHAAAVAALQRQATAATPAQVAQAQRESAVGVGAFPPSAVGAGMVDAAAAIEQLGVSPSVPGAAVEPAPPPVPCEEGSESGSESPPPTPLPTPTPTPEPPPGSPSPVQPTGGATRPAPLTFLRRHPLLISRTSRRTARAVFVFASDQADAIFLCKVDHGRFHVCPVRFVRRYSLGRHAVWVKARRNSDGATDATPAVYRFRVKRVGHGMLKRRHARHLHPG